MSESKKYRPRKPRDLTGSGVELWEKTTKAFDLEDHELSLLAELCKTMSRISQLDRIADDEGLMQDSSQGRRVHPALVEARQMRIVFARLASALKFPGDDV